MHVSLWALLLTAIFFAFYALSAFVYWLRCRGEFGEREFVYDHVIVPAFCSAACFIGFKVLV